MATAKIMFSDLRAEMARKELTIEQIAKELGMSRKTLGEKLSGKRKLYLNEAFEIVRKFFPDNDIWTLFKELSEEFKTPA